MRMERRFDSSKGQICLFVPPPDLSPITVFVLCFSYSSGNWAQMSLFHVFICPAALTKAALLFSPCLTHPSISLVRSACPLLWPFPSPPILAFISQMTGWLTVIQQMLGREGLTNCFNSNQLLLLSRGAPHNPLPA